MMAAVQSHCQRLHVVVVLLLVVAAVSAQEGELATVVHLVLQEYGMVSPTCL